MAFIGLKLEARRWKLERPIQSFVYTVFSVNPSIPSGHLGLLTDRRK